MPISALRSRLVAAKEIAGCCTQNDQQPNHEQDDAAGAGDAWHALFGFWGNWNPAGTVPIKAPVRGQLRLAGHDLESIGMRKTRTRGSRVLACRREHQG